MPTYTVTAHDRRWFDRCRRAWDLGARVRRDLGPVESSTTRTLADAFCAALAVHYYPGMWQWDRSIVDGLVTQAYRDAHGPQDGLGLLAEFQAWSAHADRFTPIRVEVDLDVAVPDPSWTEDHLASPEGHRVRYRHRVPLVALDDDSRCWIVEHRVVEEFASDDEIALDENGLVACWAWGETELALPTAGTSYTEIRADPPAMRRTDVARSPGAILAAADRLGRTIQTMLATGADPDPTPEWSHCCDCPFRRPCLAMQRGDDAEPVLARDFAGNPPDDLEEGRLGGVSWGMGRGARPKRF